MCQRRRLEASPTPSIHSTRAPSLAGIACGVFFCSIRVDQVSLLLCFPQVAKVNARTAANSVYFEGEGGVEPGAGGRGCLEGHVRTGAGFLNPDRDVPLGGEGVSAPDGGTGREGSDSMMERDAGARASGSTPAREAAALAALARATKTYEGAKEDVKKRLQVRLRGNASRRFWPAKVAARGECRTWGFAEPSSLPGMGVTSLAVVLSGRTGDGGLPQDMKVSRLARVE